MRDLNKIIDFITASNWVFLLVGGFLGAIFAAPKTTLGIVLGGLIVAVNFHLLKRTLKNMLNADAVSEKGKSVVGNVLVKYYIRFIISGALIFLLISQHIVHPIGLLAGLSVVVASVFLATMLEIKRLFFKEAV